MALLSGKSFTRLFLSVLAGTALASLVLPQVAWGQSFGTTDRSQDLQQDTPDPLTGLSTGQGFSVLDMIHRANRGNLPSMDDFSAEQRENIDTAAAEFFKQQRAILQNPSDQPPASANSAAPATAPQPGN